ncbi:MAG: LamG domain-containing protein [Candidatus Poribacteria bacterium]|nr:LamG domain-containing protein [Candidatus Poribacteria bacterium]
MKGRMLSILVFLLAMGIAAIAQAKEDDTLALYFPFDEGNGKTAKDLSAFGKNNGKLEGPKWVDGFFKKALEFDGSSYVAVMPATEEVSIGEETTWELWFKTNDTAQSANLATLHGTMILSLSGGKPRAQIWTNPGGALWNTLDSNVSIKSGQWHHVAATWTQKAAELLIYVDGDKKAALPAKGVKSFKAGRQLAIGGNDQDRYAGTGLFKGVIDDVRIYNRALTADEVKAGLTRLAVFPRGKLSTTWGTLKSQR